MSKKCGRSFYVSPMCFRATVSKQSCLGLSEKAKIYIGHCPMANKETSHKDYILTSSLFVPSLFLLHITIITCILSTMSTSPPCESSVWGDVEKSKTITSIIAATTARNLIPLHPRQRILTIIQPLLVSHFRAFSLDVAKTSHRSLVSLEISEESTCALERHRCARRWIILRCSQVKRHRCAPRWIVLRCGRNNPSVRRSTPGDEALKCGNAAWSMLCSSILILSPNHKQL